MRIRCTQFTPIHRSPSGNGSTRAAMSLSFSKPSSLMLAVSLALGLPMSATASFPAEIELSSLDGNNGFVINGELEDDFSGRSVSDAGDVNGDGIDDLIIGAHGADPNDTYSGRSYLVFGTDDDLPNPLNLSSLNRLNGIVFNGEAADHRAGWSVSGNGDINGDGIEDLIIGAILFDPNGSIVGSGRSYVVFGSNSGLPNPFDLSSINQLNGFALDGEAEEDGAGWSVSADGDFNGDGINDLIIGAPLADPNGETSGRSYVVFGSNAGLPNPFNLSTLNGSNGFVINGEAAGNFFGARVGTAGDVNGDGIDDLIIGAYLADFKGVEAGRSYVIFGSTTGLPTPFNLSTLNGSNGFVINGEAAGDRLGNSVSAAGDFNGDGIDDLVIGAPGLPASSVLGRTYVVFGSNAGLPNPFDLSTLNGTNGFAINGEAAGDRLGVSVSAAGDVNGDGFDDLVIGAPVASPNGLISGRTYVVFGSSVDLPNPFQLGSLDGSNGFVLNGEAAGDVSGASVSAAGDINGDGIDDLIVGAQGATPNGSDSGRSYVIFGRGDTVFSDRFERE